MAMMLLCVFFAGDDRGSDGASDGDGDDYGPKTM